MLNLKLTETFKKYTSEFLLIFISVILAFALTEWSSNRGEKVSEEKILLEIKNGINSDLVDLGNNLENHKYSKRSIKLLRNWTNDKQSTINNDSLAFHMLILYRNYTPVINKTGYESLKQVNLKTITNDSLRFQIIKLYDYHYNILDVLENKNEEMQDFKTYFSPINSLLAPYMVFDEMGNLIRLNKSQFSQNQKNEMLSYLWRMEISRNFKIMRYDEVLEQIKKLDKSIELELKK